VHECWLIWRFKFLYLSQQGTKKLYIGIVQKLS